MCTLSNRIGLFAAAGVLALGVRAQAQQTPAAAPDNLAVVGITQIGDRVQVVLVDLDTRRRLTVAPGQTAFGYQVRGVEAERVRLTRNGREYAIRLGEREVPVAAAPVPRPAAPAPAVVPNYPGVVTSPVILPGPLDPGEPNNNSAPPTLPEATEGIEPGPYLDPSTYPGYYPGYPPPGYGYGEVPETGVYPGFVPPYPGAVPDYPVYAPQYPGAYAPELTYAPWLAPAPGPYSPAPVYAPAVPRWNPQTARRRSGDYFSAGPALNPQTLRRRTVIRRLAPGAAGAPYYWPGYGR